MTMIDFLDTIDIFYIQIFGIVSAGSFIGELQRSLVIENYNRTQFIANSLTSIFLSSLISASFFMLTNLKEVTLILGGLLSYQDEKFLQKVGKSLTHSILKSNGNGGNGNGNGDGGNGNNANNRSNGTNGGGN